jgi:hypothetical protein
MCFLRKIEGGASRSRSILNNLCRFYGNLVDLKSVILKFAEF